MNKAFFFLISILLPSVISCAEEPSADPISPEKFTSEDLAKLKDKLYDIPMVQRNAQEEALLKILGMSLALQKNSVALKNLYHYDYDTLSYLYSYCADIGPEIMTKLLNSLYKDDATGLVEVQYSIGNGLGNGYSKENIRLETLNDFQNNLKDKTCPSCNILSDFVQAQLVLLKEVSEKKRLHELAKITQIRQEIDALLNK